MEGTLGTDPAAVNDNVLMSPSLDDTCTEHWNEITGNSKLLNVHHNSVQ